MKYKNACFLKNIVQNLLKHSSINQLLSTYWNIKIKSFINSNSNFETIILIKVNKYLKNSLNSSLKNMNILIKLIELL